MKTRKKRDILASAQVPKQALGLELLLALYFSS
jgi:hypothetical protein